MKKVCKDCGSKTRPATKPGPRCATCHRAVKKERRDRAHAKRVEKVYGLTDGEYDALLAFQGGVCYLCGKPPVRKRLSVDHNHRTGRVRGLIHAWENTILGRIRDSLDWAKNLVSYLEKSPAERAGLDRKPGETPS